MICIRACSETLLRYEQATLDGSITKVPAFTTNGLLDYMVELIVCEDKVMTPSLIYPL